MRDLHAAVDPTDPRHEKDQVKVVEFNKHLFIWNSGVLS